MGIKERLSLIKYQEIKDPNSILPRYDDAQKVKAVQSLYDAAIDNDTQDLTDANFPPEVMGVAITWSADKKIISLSTAEASIDNDDLTDSYIPSVSVAELSFWTFEFDGQPFQLRSGENFEIRPYGQ